MNVNTIQTKCSLMIAIFFSVIMYVLTKLFTDKIQCQMIYFFCRFNIYIVDLDVTEQCLFSYLFCIHV